MNLSRIARFRNNLQDTVEKHVAIWQLKQELEGLEHMQRFSNEGHILATLKLRNDLETLRGSRTENTVSKCLETYYQQQACCNGRVAKTVD